MVLDDAPGQAFVREVASRFEQGAPGTLSAQRRAEHFEVRRRLRATAATVVTAGSRWKWAVSVSRTHCLRVDGDAFLSNREGLQTEAFGTVNMIVLARDRAADIDIADRARRQLTGCPTATPRGDDAAYARLAPVLPGVSADCWNDKMPTGVAVSPAMNHTAVPIRRRATPASPPSGCRHPCFGSRRCTATTTCARTACRLRLPTAIPPGRCGRMVDGDGRSGVCDARCKSSCAAGRCLPWRCCCRLRSSDPSVAQGHRRPSCGVHASVTLPDCARSGRAGPRGSASGQTQAPAAQPRYHRPCWAHDRSTARADTGTGDRSRRTAPQAILRAASLCRSFRRPHRC